MSAKRNEKNRPPATNLPDAGESRGAVALTVAWMLACMSTAVAMLVVIATRLLLAGVADQARAGHPLSTIGGVILLVATATGLLCLVLTPLAYRVRRSPPPQPITIAAVLISLAPLATLVILAISG